MKVLAVDATSEHLNLALVDGGRAWRRRVQAGGRHDEKIFIETRRLLARAGWKLDDLDAIAAASGPGSFTGIRVGMTFVAMLARTLGRPAVAVTLFEAEAFRTTAALPGAERRVLGVVFPVRRPALRNVDRRMKRGALDTARIIPPGARGAELFFQAFELTKGRKRPAVRSLGGPRWFPLAEWPKALAQTARGRRVLLTGPGAREAAEGLRGGRVRVEVRECGELSAEHLVPPATERLAEGGTGEFAPLYLKPAYYDRVAH